MHIFKLSWTWRNILNELFPLISSLWVWTLGTITGCPTVNGTPSNGHLVCSIKKYAQLEKIVLLLSKKNCSPHMYHESTCLTMLVKLLYLPNIFNLCWYNADILFIAFTFIFHQCMISLETAWFFPRFQCASVQVSSSLCRGLRWAGGAGTICIHINHSGNRTRYVSCMNDSEDVLWVISEQQPWGHH